MRDPELADIFPFASTPPLHVVMFAGTTTATAPWFMSISRKRGVDLITADWSPATAAGGDQLFYKQGNLIIDMKEWNSTPDIWNQINVGDKFYTFTQRLRINWTDPCGNVWMSQLGMINLARKKVSATEWQLVEN